MAFWSTQRVQAEQKKLGNLIDPFDSDRVKQGAYELALSREVATARPKGLVKDGKGKTLEIGPGQFAILYTQERVTLPSSVIAFISIKASVKFDGLVNISGFHVDPGFSGHLKFSVYNAGTGSIFLEYNLPAFLIWFSDLDQATIDPYDGNHKNQSRITPADRREMSRPTYSPAALNERLTKVERRFSTIFKVAGVIVTAIITAIVFPIVRDWIQTQPKKTKTGEEISATASPAPSTPQQPFLASATPAATLTPTPPPTSTPARKAKGKRENP